MKKRKEEATPKVDILLRDCGTVTPTRHAFTYGDAAAADDDDDLANPAPRPLHPGSFEIQAFQNCAVR